MTTTQIQYFLEVAKCESFSKAAENLYVSHQVLSNQLKALEKELGLTLIDRSNKRNICLTDAGKVMFEAWTQIREIYSKAFHQAVRLQDSAGKSLVIGIQDMRFVRSYVVPIIRNLQNSPENFSLEYRLGSPTEMFEMLDTGQVDMLIMISSDVSRMTKYHSAVLCEDALHLVAAMSKKHPLAKRKNLSFEDLTNETILMIGESYSGEAAKRFQQDLETFNAKPKKIINYNGPRAINLAVEMNSGVALLFDELLEEAREEIKTFPMNLPNAMGTDMLLVWKDPRFEKMAERIIRVHKEDVEQ